MKLRRKFTQTVFVLFLIELFLSGGLASADTIFFLDNVTFSDGRTATGYFDPSFNNINVTTSPAGAFGATYATPNVYGASEAGSYLWIAMVVDFGNGSYSELQLTVEQLSLTASNPLVTSPTPGFPSTSCEFYNCQSLEIVGTFSSPNQGYRYIVSGSLDPINTPISSVPIPAVGTGLPGLIAAMAAGLLAWRHRRRTRTA
jgi:hypothetical protein